MAGFKKNSVFTEEEQKEILEVRRLKRREQLAKGKMIKSLLNDGCSTKSIMDALRLSKQQVQMLLGYYELETAKQRSYEKILSSLDESSNEKN